MSYGCMLCSEQLLGRNAHARKQEPNRFEIGFIHLSPSWGGVGR
jgi:hypothetical protein